LVSSWARNGSFRDAAEFGDIARFFIRKCRAPWPRSALRGKAIIDCNNPVEVERFTLVTQPGRSMAQYIEQVTGGHVIKAFDLSTRASGRGHRRCSMNAVGLCLTAATITWRQT
jgi:predicted dinucleotide-binding enzyme